MSISANALYEELLSCGLAESPAAELYLEQALEIFVGQPMDVDEFMAELLSESEWTPEAQIRIRTILEPYQGQQVFSVSPESFRSAAQTPKAPESVVVAIGGKDCVCYEYGATGKMLLEMNGTFGDLSIDCAMLVPMTMTEQTLEELHNLWLTEQEHEHGLPIGESCSSSSWWAGAVNAPHTVEITDRYHYLVDLALQDVQFVNLLSGESLSKYGFIDHAWSEAERQFNDCHEDEQWSDLSPEDRLEIYRDQFNHLVFDRDWSAKEVPETRKASRLDGMIQSATKRQATQAVPNVLPEKEISH